jgi:hypothetical protein
MGTDTIPDRTNGQTIVQSFFNLLKTVLKGDFVPRNSSGVAASGAGSLGSTTYPWQNSYVKSDGDYYIGSNKLIAPHDNNIKTLSANYTILDNDRYSHFLVTTGSSANITITLPTAADNKGRRFSFHKVDAGTKYIEVSPEGSEEIRGSNTSIYVTDENETLELLCNGTGYILLGNHLRTVSMLVNISTGNGLESQFGDVAASASYNSTGSSSITIGSGVFSSEPVVAVTPWDINANDIMQHCTVYVPSSTSFTVVMISSSSAPSNPDTLIDGKAYLTITGAK